MSGRKTLLTPELQADIVQALQLGATQRDASHYVGITEQTFCEWVRKGDEETGSEPYISFASAVKKAKARGVVGWLAKIERAASEGSWQAAAWKLERTNPEGYGRHIVEQKHSGQVVHAHAWIERLQQSFEASRPALPEPRRDEIVDVDVSEQS